MPFRAISVLTYETQELLEGQLDIGATSEVTAKAGNCLLWSTRHLYAHAQYTYQYQYQCIRVTVLCVCAMYCVYGKTSCLFFFNAWCLLRIVPRVVLFIHMWVPIPYKQDTVVNHIHL